MLTHRLSPFAAWRSGRSSPAGLAVTSPPQAPVVALVAPATRRRRTARTRFRGPDAREPHVQREQAAGNSQGDRAVFPSGSHGSSSRAKPLPAILIVGPGKIFINSPGVTFGKTPDGYTCPKRS
jgi:hypothetical protein